jgi:hypothetical protein
LGRSLVPAISQTSDFSHFRDPHHVSVYLKKTVAFAVVQICQHPGADRG